MEWTRSLPLTKEEGKERAAAAAAAAAASPQPLSLGSAAAEGFGENPARSPRLRSLRRLSRRVPILASPLPDAQKGSGPRELYPRLQNWPEPETAAAAART